MALIIRTIEAVSPTGSPRSSAIGEHIHASGTTSPGSSSGHSGSDGGWRILAVQSQADRRRAEEEAAARRRRLEDADRALHRELDRREQEIRQRERQLGLLGRCHLAIGAAMCLALLGSAQFGTYLLTGHERMVPGLDRHRAETQRLSRIVGDDIRRAARHPVGSQAIGPWLRSHEKQSQGYRKTLEDMERYQKLIRPWTIPFLNEVLMEINGDLHKRLRGDRDLRRLQEQWEAGQAGGQSGLPSPDREVKHSKQG